MKPVRLGHAFGPRHYRYKHGRTGLSDIVQGMLARGQGLSPEELDACHAEIQRLMAARGRPQPQPGVQEFRQLIQERDSPAAYQAGRLAVLREFQAGRKAAVAELARSIRALVRKLPHD